MSFRSHLSRAELKRWTAALRSGEYCQTEDRLCHQEEEDGPYCYCCLGVLAVTQGVSVGLIVDNSTLDDIGHGDWLGDFNRDPGNLQSVLADMNDGREGPKRSFPEIADWIDANVLPQASGSPITEVKE